MSAKTSKEVTDRQRSCQFLLSAFEHQGREISERLAETVRPWLGEGESEPDFQSPVYGLGLWLEASLEALVELDEDVYEKSARLAKTRHDRDTAIVELAQEVSHLRLSIENQYQAPQIGRLGFETPTPRIAVPLLRQAERLVESLGSAELGVLLGEPRYDQPFDPSTHREALATRIEAVGGLLRQINGLKRDIDRAVVHKRRAMDEHDEVFLHTARNFEALCRLAKETQLADRVRPSLRHPGRVETPDADQQGDGGGDAAVVATAQVATAQVVSAEAVAAAAGETRDMGEAGGGSPTSLPYPGAPSNENRLAAEQRASRLAS